MAAAIGIGIAVSPPDSPWCGDTGGDCPAEVLYNDRLYVVYCSDYLGGIEQTRLKVPARLRHEQLRVRYHSGDDETERRAWTVPGVEPAEVIVLDDAASCGGTMLATAAQGGVFSASATAANLRRLAADE